MVCILDAAVAPMRANRANRAHAPPSVASGAEALSDASKGPSS